MEQNTSEKYSRTYVAAALVVLVFIIASVGAIMWMESQKIQTLENNTEWLESRFEKSYSQQLSTKQKDIIQNSVAILSNVVQDAGVKVSLKSVCGNGYITYFKVDVELPEGINAGYGCHFENTWLNINEDKVGLGSSGSGGMTLEDDNPTDNRYSLLINTRVDYNPIYDFAFNNGNVRTLCLENIKLKDESGQQSKLIEGQWDFSILFHDEGKAVELVQEPVIVMGVDYLWGDKWYDATVSSFVLTEFSAYCQYKMAENSDSLIGMYPVVILKDGSTIRLSPKGGSNTNYEYVSETPIVLNEVAFVKLTDDVVLPFPRSR